MVAEEGEHGANTMAMTRSKRYWFAVVFCIVFGGVMTLRGTGLLGAGGGANTAWGVVLLVGGGFLLLSAVGLLVPNKARGRG